MKNKKVKRINNLKQEIGGDNMNDLNNIFTINNLFDYLNNKNYTSYEKVFIAGTFFKNKRIDYQKYVIGKNDDYHIFISYKINNKYYYLEPDLKDFKGIYEYNSKEEMEQDIYVKYIYHHNIINNDEPNYDDYFLKPIKDLDQDKSIRDYTEYFNSVEKIIIRKSNYKNLINLTNLVVKEILLIGNINNNDSKYFYKSIVLPNKKDFLDINEWCAKVYEIIRKNIINICFYKKNNSNIVYTLNSLGNFNKFNNMLGIGNYKNQLIYNKEKVYNIFTIEDLNTYLSINDGTSIKEILTFSMKTDNKKDIYEYGCNFVTNLSKKCIKSINEKEIEHKLINKVDIDLNGEIVKQITLTNANFLDQISIVGSALEIMSKSINLIVNKDYSNDFINMFVDYFIYMVDIKTIDLERIENNINDNSNFVTLFITSFLSKMINKKLTNN